MGAEAFLDWAAGEQDRYELIGGAPVAMAPERAGHAAAKTEIARQLGNQLPPGAPCQVFVDGLGLVTQSDDVFIPDVLVHCAAAEAPLTPEQTTVRQAALIVEVLSPSTRIGDMTVKLSQYLHLPGLVAVILVDLEMIRALVFRGPGAVAEIVPRSGAAAFSLAAGQAPVSIAFSDVFDRALGPQQL